MDPSCRRQQLLEVLEEASSIAERVESQDLAPSGTTPLYYPLAQKLYPSYTNFSLVPTTTRRDTEPFVDLLVGRGALEVEDVTATSSIRGFSQGRNTKKKRGPSQRRCFPNILHEALSDPNLSDVIAWMPHGRSWSILDSSAFVERVSKKYFSQNKLDSFKRQVRGWGFRLKRRGPDRGSYYHELFLRGMPHLVQYMETKQRALNSPKSTLSSVDEPDLFAISTMYHVPLSRDATERVQVQEDDRETKREETGAVAGTFVPVLSTAGEPSPVTSFAPSSPSSSTTSYPNKLTTGGKRARSKFQQGMQRQRLRVLQQSKHTWQPRIGIDKFGPILLPEPACATVGSVVSSQHDASSLSFQATTASPITPPALVNGSHHEEASPAELDCQYFPCDPVILKEKEEMPLPDLHGMLEYVEHLIPLDAPQENHIDGTMFKDKDNKMWAALSQQNISLDLSDLELIMSLDDDDEASDKTQDNSTQTCLHALGA